MIGKNCFTTGIVLDTISKIMTMTYGIQALISDMFELDISLTSCFAITHECFGIKILYLIDKVANNNVVIELNHSNKLIS